jgi:hypothetical protein
MSDGIIYYNEGTKLLARLVVSLSSLQKHYQGPITLISVGKESNEYAYKIAWEFGIDLQAIDKTDLIDGKHKCFLEKARIHTYSPYDRTIFLDSDTIILKPFPELFTKIDKTGFIVPQFSTWTTQTGVIKKRLKEWGAFYPEDVENTIKSNAPSVNVGVFGFNKDSELMKLWFDYTKVNRMASLPEEISCHLLLSRGLGEVIESKYNYSCKYDKSQNPVIIHYHGRKHCRVDNGKLLYNGDLWVKEWEEVGNRAGVKDWGLNIGDKQLKRFLKK